MTPGFVGVLPRSSGLVAVGLDEGVLSRWDRWWELASAGGVPPLADDRPAWRLQARAGLFAPEPVAGCLRLGRDRDGRVYPCAVLRAGPLPDTADPWFDGAEALVRAATDGELTAADPPRRLARLALPRLAGMAIEVAVRLWRDDWTVREIALVEAAHFARLPPILLAERDAADPGKAA